MMPDEKEIPYRRKRGREAKQTMRPAANAMKNHRLRGDLWLGRSVVGWTAFTVIEGGGGMFDSLLMSGAGEIGDTL